MRTIALLLLLTSTVQANPYFRAIDPAHPQPVVGALIAPEKLGATSAASLLPLITHSPKDGCFLPAIACTDWTPLAVGGSMNAGKLTFDVAPLMNVLPWMQGLALSLMPGSWQGARSIVAPSIDGSVTISAGPVWEYQQATNKGYFRIFSGLALHF